MNIPILLTKVTPPHRRDEIFTRQRLIDQLESLLDKKLIVVTAPAGYGKTSLMVDYSRRSILPMCWYSIDSADGDIHRFLHHFCASIELRFPRFGERSKSALIAYSNGDITIDTLVVAIVNEIFGLIKEHFIIVLDDYQLVNQSDEINAFLNRFIQDVDQNCHIVILTRTFISLLDLPLLVASSEAGGIGLLDLAFQADEIRGLMKQNFQQEIPWSIAKELEQKTEGWIAGLILSAHRVWQDMVDNLRVMRASGAGLYEYLVHQVLDQQPAEIRSFLLRTSFFEAFDAQLCEALLGSHPSQASWQQTINWVVKNNLFVLPIGDQFSWIRYHHLFRDFLQNRFEQEEPEEMERLLRALVKIYADRQEWERAYDICLRLGDIDWTVDFLTKAGEPMVRDGRIRLLGSWLEALPETVIIENPALQARKGIILATQGDTRRGLQLLDQSIQHFRALRITDRLAGTLVWRALVHHIRSSWEQSMTDAGETLSLTESEQDVLSMQRFRAEAFRVLGQNFRMIGNLDDAITNLQRALEIYQMQDDRQGANLVILNLGNLHLDAGDFSSALSCYEQTRDYYLEQGNLYSLSAALNNIGYVQHLRGHYQESMMTYEEALAKAAKTGISQSYMPILISMGDLFTDLGAYDAAREAYRRACKLLAKVGDRFVSIYLTLAEASLARKSGDIAGAQVFLGQACQLAGKGESNYINGLLLLESGQQQILHGDLLKSETDLVEAVDLFEQSGQKVLAGRANLVLAAVYHRAGSVQPALDRLHAVGELFSENEDLEFLLPESKQALSFLKSLVSSPKAGSIARSLIDRVRRFEAELPGLRHELRFKELTIPFTPPKLQIQALGASRVLSNNELVTGVDWQTKGTREIFYFLLSTSSGWSREAMGEQLWPGISPEKSRSLIKNAVYRLRSALQQNVINYDGLYQINRDLDYEYDVERFEELYVLSQNASKPEERIKWYQELMKVYAGEYLPDFDGAWVETERERLRQIYLISGLKLCELYFDAGEVESALQVSSRLITFDPYLEPAYCIAMQAHAALGNRMAVIRQYENLKTNLKTGLDLAPSKQTESLFSSLVNQ